MRAMTSGMSCSKLTHQLEKISSTLFLSAWMPFIYICYVKLDQALAIDESCKNCTIFNLSDKQLFIRIKRNDKCQLIKRNFS